MGDINGVHVDRDEFTEWREAEREEIRFSMEKQREEERLRRIAKEGSGNGDEQSKVD